MLMVVLFGLGFSNGGMVGMCSLSLMESVPPSLSATSLGIGDCLAHLGQYVLFLQAFSISTRYSVLGEVVIYWDLKVCPLLEVS